jgi:GWxTD domain-containing protein
MKIRRYILPGILLLGMAACSASGTSVRSLPDADRQFLSEVRYIITGAEKKLFRRLGPEERKQFIEEFWKKRDPSPGTDENEYRDEYYARIDTANRLFREGSSGWLSDRGRVYILLGEPERRSTYPSGYSFYELPMEIWYYHDFTLLFIDYTYTGIYKLEPASVRQLGVITSTQMRLKPGIEAENNQVLFDFAARTENVAAGEVKLVIDIPYERLKMVEKSQAPGTIATELKIVVRVAGADEKKVLEKEETYPVSLQADALETLARNLTIELPLRLEPGKYSALVTLINAADKSQVSKKIKFSL